ncbi:MAG: hypothetical protein Q8K63_07385 [Acidimicrobiales bacterium]|nr:hypothetical protein [Acidimicrobiales bacterium]
MRRRTPLVLGALVFAGVAVGSGAGVGATNGEGPSAQQVPDPTTTAVRDTTTTSPAVTVAPDPTTPPSTAKPTTTTSVKAGATTSTTAVRGPVPPPASGASQPLDPSLLGGLPGLELNPSTTTPSFSTEADLTTTTTPFADDNAISVSNPSGGPTGATLALASVAWLASLGGLLIYAEEQRSRQWRHLAR